MPLANDIPSASLGLALGIFLIALFLGLRQWYERRARDLDLSPADHAHFSQQDARRNLGVAVLLAIAAIVVVTTRLEPKVEGKANPTFAELWIIVLALIVVLLALAMLDWLATRVYARRHRRQMIRESLEAIRHQARPSSPTRNGEHPEDRPDSLPSDPSPSK
jgi:UDP-N-acetylmuramyl pentapeptide phosphotransferase/UDP-N-acetylglucosamine-1-phosphate transferase